MTDNPFGKTDDTTIKLQALIGQYAPPSYKRVSVTTSYRGYRSDHRDSLYNVALADSGPVKSPQDIEREQALREYYAAITPREASSDSDNPAQ
jgi:hypothetical protein